MLIIAIVMFATTALGGLVLASHLFRRVFAPWLLSLAHAILGASSITVLAIALARSAGDPAATLALVLFIVAALGGLTLAGFHLRKRIPPKGTVLIHAGLAATSFLVLISLVFRA